MHVKVGREGGREGWSQSCVIVESVWVEAPDLFCDRWMFMSNKISIEISLFNLTFLFPNNKLKTTKTTDHPYVRGGCAAVRVARRLSHRHNKVCACILAFFFMSLSVWWDTRKSVVIEFAFLSSLFVRSGLICLSLILIYLLYFSLVAWLLH